MNKERRKKLGNVFDRLCEVQKVIEEVRQEEYESLENLPDNFRFGERGDEMQNYIDMLDEAAGYIDDAKSVIEQV